MVISISTAPSKFILLGLFTFIFLSTRAQSGAFNLSAVPENIKLKAEVVTHLEEAEYQVEDLEKATYKVHKVYTVMNEEGKHALFFNLYSSKYSSLEEVELKVFDANGKQTGKYKKKDMATMAMGEGLIEDGYSTLYRVSATTFPISVDLKFEYRFRNTLNVPGFHYISANEGVMESNYTVRIPEGINLRYKAKNTELQPVITDEGKYKLYKWSVKNIPPAEYEVGAAGDNSRYPHVDLALDRFSAYGIAGDLSSWKSLGSWMGSLYVGLDKLSPERQQFFLNLVKDADSEREKIRRIYTYMQKNFRYVSIQLGIGGMRPFSAEFTDQKKYGDCKALSNYMLAALKVVGIRSHVAIINAQYNYEPVDESFPSSPFNHAILCVPQAKDSIWLECTSQTAEFGELGTFTENRNALLVTEDGGHLVPTPASRASANVMTSVTKVEVEPTLGGITRTSFHTRGQYTELMNDLLKGKKDEQKQAIVYYLGYKQPDDFELIRTDKDNDHTTQLNMAYPKIPEFTSGNKWFMSPRIYKLWTSKLPKSDKRTLDYYFRHPFEKYDTTIYKLPAGSSPEVLTSQKELNCDYASYQYKSWYNESDHSIYSATTLILKKHKIPAKDYGQVKKFFDDLGTEDAQRFVLKAPEVTKKAF